MPTTRAQAAGKTQENGAPKGKEAKAGEKRPRAEKGGRKGSKKAKQDKDEDVSGKQDDEKEEQPSEEVKEDKEPAGEEKEEPTTEAAETGQEDKTEAKEDKATEAEGDTETADKEAPAETEASGILERGHIYFFYRPKVQLTEVSSIDEVAKFTILLLPRPAESSGEAAPAAELQGKAEKRFRYIEVGKKRLPDPEGHHEVFWAAMVGYGTDIADLSEQLGEKVYQTKTRGERHIAEARLVGRGSYAIYATTDGPPSKHSTYLAYHLSHPSNPGAVQEELGIHPTSSFIIQVKNPTTSSAPQAGLKPDARADYPKTVIEENFGGAGDGKGLRFVPANPIKLLDFKGAEMLLISDKTQIDEVVGEGAASDLERTAEKDSKSLSNEAVMKELMMDAEEFPAEALEGEWV